ncbi:hypothetical protein ACPOL_0003 [Acidisarcina polymorpha]|uniref:DinB-like domain-containing protein n=1 Tax=Acidisarcina polymorpha TaxID=2211140 RepID=A0A2Z5FRT6_9BACT|nr:DinB family protein [Acidisarcina polymorpha]AXC09390.1 hypothetical protein ACPOL_0003 [Acidisarcina polymorpha]
MNELERTLVGDSAAAPPAYILEDLDEDLAHRHAPGAPRSIYEELWHIVYWQQMTLEWISGKETPYPEQASISFPEEQDVKKEGWDDLRERFFDGVLKAAAATRDAHELEVVVRCPSPPGSPVRTMTVREQLESLTAHNAYHFGRIVLLRQILGSWPPASAAV